MDLADLRIWPITPTALRRAEHGLNNDTYLVTAREGEFVVRAYRNTADVSRVRYEHDLLGRLALEVLPFAVPTLVQARGGDTLAVLETPEGPRLAALFERIAGEPAALDMANARLAGPALARLDAAFGRLDLPVRAPATLRDVHPLVDDPLAAIDELELGGRATAVREIFTRVMAEHDALAVSLPRQIIHGDFVFPNVLVADGKVTGMLDFEFAGAEIRAADLAGAMYVTVVRGDPAQRWPLLDSLASGYRGALPLDPLEAAAVPELMLRRAATGLVHWIGRWRQGIAPRDAPLERADRSVRFAEWLDANAARVAVTVSGEGIGRKS